MKISVIIPTYNEEENIAGLIGYLLKYGDDKLKEVIVVDGKSKDRTITEAKESGAATYLLSERGRARQMNFGAKQATGDVLYFLHADCLPPKNFLNQISKALNNGYDSGCFRLKFDYNHWFLRCNAWFTRFNFNAIRFGDQSLFIRKGIFDRIGEFNESLTIMEDQEIVHRISSNKYTFTVLDTYLKASARKYLSNGIYRLQFIYTLIYFCFYLGVSQKRLESFYNYTIRN